MKLAKLLKEVEFYDGRTNPVHEIKVPAGTVVQWDYCKLFKEPCIKLMSFEHSRILDDTEITGVIQFL